MTFIVPISAAIAAPTRPATTTPVKTGASSRPIAIATTPPTEEAAPKRTNSFDVCTANTMPVNIIVISTIGSESAPNLAICLTVSRISACRNLTQVSKNKITIRPVLAQERNINLPKRSLKAVNTVVSPIFRPDNCTNNHYMGIIQDKKEFTCNLLQFFVKKL